MAAQDAMPPSPEPVLFQANLDQIGNLLRSVMHEQMQEWEARQSAEMDSRVQRLLKGQRKIEEWLVAIHKLADYVDYHTRDLKYVVKEAHREAPRLGQVIEAMQLSMAPAASKIQASSRELARISQIVQADLAPALATVQDMDQAIQHLRLAQERQQGSDLVILPLLTYLTLLCCLGLWTATLSLNYSLLIGSTTLVILASLLGSHWWRRRSRIAVPPAPVEAGRLRHRSPSG